MPLLVTGLILLGLCIFAVIHFLKGKKVNLEKKGINIIIFILCLVSLVISIKLLINLGVYADKYGSSPILVSGGSFWLSMDWIRLGLLLVLCSISGFKLFSQSK